MEPEEAQPAAAAETITDSSSEDPPVADKPKDWGSIHMPPVVVEMAEEVTRGLMPEGLQCYAWHKGNRKEFCWDTSKACTKK